MGYPRRRSDGSAPMFTSRHFRKMADVIREHSYNRDPSDMDFVIKVVSACFSNDNSGFDQKRFEEYIWMRDSEK